jgi:hypothetical protein
MAQVTGARIAACFRLAVEAPCCQDKWLSDDAWVEYLCSTYHLHGLSNGQFNRAITKDVALAGLFGAHRNMRSGYYHVRRYVVGSSGSKCNTNSYYVGSRKELPAPDIPQSRIISHSDHLCSRSDCHVCFCCVHFHFPKGYQIVQECTTRSLSRDDQYS